MSNSTKLTQKQIKELEKKYGKHNFCYQCGNPDIVPIDNQHLYPGFCECPKCGSSDLEDRTDEHTTKSDRRGIMASVVSSLRRTWN